MKIAICDDDIKDANTILKYCHDSEMPYGTYETVIFSTASDLLYAFSSDFYDLVFLDIKMKNTNGYEAGLELSRRKPRPVIVFTTNFQQYAIQGYGIASRYLCKPITLSTFRQTMNEILPLLLPQKIMLAYNGIQKAVSVNEILYFESLAHHIIFHLTESRRFEIKDTLEHVLQRIQQPNFFRVHRSFCVNLDYVDTIKPSQITMTDGAKIPISRNKQEALLERFTHQLKGC